MTCLNSLKLKQIQEKNPSVFDMPKSICIPMTIPVHFAIKEAGIYKKMKSMFKQIDALSSQDSLIGKEVLDSLLKAANSVISSNDQQVT